MAFITDEQLKAALAAHLKQAVGELPTGIDTVIANANASAYQEIVSRLTGRGFSAAQIASWDRGAEFNRDIGLFWCLVNTANLSADDKWVMKLDRREELDTVNVLVGGAQITPGGTSPRTGRGAMSNSTDVFTMDTEW